MAAIQRFLGPVTPALGADTDGLLAPALHAVVVGLGVISVAVPLLAHRRLWPRLARQWRLRRLPPASGRIWLVRYAGVALVCALAAFALAPTTVMTWQEFVVLHVAVLPLVLFAAACLRTRRRTIARRVVAAWLAASVVSAAIMAVGADVPAERPFGAHRRAAHLPSHARRTGDQRALQRAGRPVNGWWVNALSWPATAPTPAHR